MSLFLTYNIFHTITNNFFIALWPSKYFWDSAVSTHGISLRKSKVAQKKINVFYKEKRPWKNYYYFPVKILRNDCVKGCIKTLRFLINSYIYMGWTFVLNVTIANFIEMYRPEKVKWYGVSSSVIGWKLCSEIRAQALYFFHRRGIVL